MRRRTGIILAWDKSYLNDAEIKLIKDLAPHVDMFKVGLEAMTAEDPTGTSLAAKVRKISPKPVFWDMKLGDTKNTLDRALRNIAEHVDKVRMVTLHATVSDEALRSAAAFQERTPLQPLAVTVLTDLDDGECKSRFGDTPENTVVRFTEMVRTFGLRGLACSPKELAILRKRGLLESMTIVLPGIRSAGSNKHDQKRVMTPTEAAQAGADYIVIGRPIMEAPDPIVAAVAIRRELDQALA